MDCFSEQQVITMWDPNNYKIVCYLAWCGAEVEHQFDNQSRYDAVRAFLSKIAKVHVPGDQLPLKYSGRVTDFYAIENEQREAFQNFMRDIPS